MGIKPAGIRKHPNERVFYFVRLWTDRRIWRIEGYAKGTDTENRHRSRAIFGNLFPKACGTSNQFRAIQFTGGESGAIYKIGNAVAAAQQFVFFIWSDPSACKAGSKESRPEAIARTRKVMAGPGRIESGIDSAEEDLQIVVD